MFKKDALSRRILSVLLLVVVGVTAFLLSRNSTPEKGAGELAAKPVTRTGTSSFRGSPEVIPAEMISANASAQSAAARPVYRFESPVVAGKPAAIPARFSTPSAAEATIRSARLAELIEGSLSSLRQGDTIQLPLPDNRFVSARINVVQREADGQVLLGGYLTGDIKGTFSLGEDDSRLGGVIVPTEGKVAYQIETGRDGAAYLLEKNKGSVVCMELPVMVVSRAVVREAQRGDVAESFVIPDSSSVTTSAASAPEYSLSSRPTATAVAYLDFDGENVTDSNWNGGNMISASASGLSADQITEIWQRVSEDYRPFNIDVTTNRSRYDNAPAGSRMRCIITQNNGWYGSAGGVAYIGSWSASGGGGMSSTIPCWVFSNLLSLNSRYVGEAVSHEIGHTLGLSHDGLNDGSGNFLQSYYSGHGNGATTWAPIMGSGYYNNVVQWSNGNYSTNGNVGSNTENDLAIISDSGNHAGYMTDDAGGTRAAASALRFSSGSSVSTIGLIERSGDVDMYSFTTSGGSVSFSLVAESNLTGLPNLDARATLYDASGNTVADSNPTGSLFPSISTTLSSGTYYIAVAGVGEGSVPGFGYTNYGSLGRYEITGTVVASVAQPPVITSASSGSAVTGSSFNFQVTASNSPTSYGASGLPSGLSINTGTGAISGTVSSSATAGVYSVTLTAANSSGSGSQTFSLTLTNPLPAAPSITSGSTGSVVRGNSFSHQITASNTPTSYGASGLPTGLSINTSSGQISGTVSTSVSAAVYSITLTANNAGGTGTQTFFLTVTNPLPAAPVITSASASSAVIGSAFSHQVTASNSPTSYAASGFPSGVSINSSTGQISGTVSSSATAGVYTVTIIATNAGGSGSQTFLLTLTNPLPSAPVISSVGVGSVVSGSSFSYQITASNSPTSYGASGLPAGLSVNTSTGAISGTVSSSVTAGIYTVTLSATNAGGSGTKILAITVTAPVVVGSVPVITSAASVRVVLGVDFSFQVVATNSPTSYVALGLPPGMTIDGVSGRISGSPPLSMSTGLYAATVTVTNATGSATQVLALEVKSAFAAWAQDKQIGDINSVSAADPDGDGMGNLLEYAFDLSPSSADTVSVTQVAVVNASGTRRMEISFIRPSNRPDLVYTVEVSANMMAWTTGHAYGSNVTNGSGLPTQEMERTSLGAAGERIRVRDIGGVDQRFIRVRVSSL